MNTATTDIELGSDQPLVVAGIGNDSNAPLQLSPIKIKEDYRKKWNISENDFVCLTKNGQLVSSSLYRVGGLGSANDIKKDYFLLLKYVEAFYADNITKEVSRKPHLEGRWCIIDKNGIEKVEFDAYKSPYLKGGVIYCIDNKFCNIETGEVYCDSYTAISSTDYLFLENAYDKDKSKRGVMKINKKDGSYELFS